MPGGRPARLRIARVEPEQFLARIHQNLGEADLHPVRRQAVLGGIGLDRLGALVHAEDRVRPVQMDVAVQQRRDLEAAELEAVVRRAVGSEHRSEEHTSELQSLMRNSYAVFCLKKKKQSIAHK